MPSIDALRGLRLITAEQAIAARRYSSLCTPSLAGADRVGLKGSSLGSLTRPAQYGVSDVGEWLEDEEAALERAERRDGRGADRAAAQRVLDLTGAREATDALVLERAAALPDRVMTAKAGLDALHDHFQGVAPDHAADAHALDPDLDAAMLERLAEAEEVARIEAQTARIEAEAAERNGAPKGTVAALMGRAGTERRKLKGVRASRRGRGVTHDRAVTHYGRRAA